MENDKSQLHALSDDIDVSLDLRNDVPIVKRVAMTKVLFRHWCLSPAEQAALLGLPEIDAADLLTDQLHQAIFENSDTVNRIYYLLGIHARLRVLLSPHDLVYKWMRSPNMAFNDMTPIQLIERDGVAGMAHITRYLNFYVFN